MPVLPVDHVVIRVKDRLDEAERRYRELGFRLTRRAGHGGACASHLAVLETEHIALCGSLSRDCLASANLPGGLNAVAFTTADAHALYDQQRAGGMPVRPVRGIARVVECVDERRAEAQFNMVALEPGAVFDGDLCFHEPLTPALAWSPLVRDHPNGAVWLDRIAISAQDPGRVVGGFERLFGAGVVAAPATRDAPHLLWAGDVRIEIWHWSPLARALGEAMPDPAGRRDFMALLGIRVRSVYETATLLQANRVRDIRIEVSRVLVPASEAMNVAIEFV
jgi:catechol 2,3-dioxygenase-like lactoylglutathione lyase family enzyme